MEFCYICHYYSAGGILLIRVYVDMSSILALYVYSKEQNKEHITKKKLSLQIYSIQGILDIGGITLNTHTMQIYLPQTSEHLTRTGTIPFFINGKTRVKGHFHKLSDMKIIKAHNYNTFTLFYRENLTPLNAN